MKYFIAVLLSTVILLSCHTNSAPNQSINQSTDSLSTIKQLITKFNPIICGDWVWLDYINDLKKTRSPFLSQEKAECLIIDTSKWDGSKIPFLCDYGSGGLEDGCNLFYESGIAPNSIVVIFGDNVRYDLGYKITKNDTLLILYKFDSSENKIVSQKEYEKVKASLKTIENIPEMTLGGLEYFNNQILMSGTYYYLDSLNNKKIACFTDFGKVTGFENFRNYYIEDIFGHGPGDNEDIFYFDFQLNSQRDYNYKIHNDTVDIIQLSESPNYDTVYSSTLKYRLVRQK